MRGQGRKAYDRYLIVSSPLVEIGADLSIGGSLFAPDVFVGMFAHLLVPRCFYV